MVGGGWSVIVSRRLKWSSNTLLRDNTVWQISDLWRPIEFTSSNLCLVCTADVSSFPVKTFDREPDHFSYFSSSDFSWSIHGAFSVSVSESNGVMLLSFESRMLGLSLTTTCGEGDCRQPEEEVYDEESDDVDDVDAFRGRPSKARELSDEEEDPEGLVARWGDFDGRCGGSDVGDVERVTLFANDGNGNESGVLFVFFSLAARRLS